MEINLNTLDIIQRGLVLQFADATINQAQEGIQCILGVQYIMGSIHWSSDKFNPYLWHTSALVLMISSLLLCDTWYVGPVSPNVPTSFSSRITYNFLQIMAILLEALSIGTITYLLCNSARYVVTISSCKIGLVCCGVLTDFMYLTLSSTFCLMLN